MIVGVFIEQTRNGQLQRESSKSSTGGPGAFSCDVELCGSRTKTARSWRYVAGEANVRRCDLFQ